MSDLRWHLYLTALVVVVVTSWCVTAAWAARGGPQLDTVITTDATDPVIFQGDT